jgi:endonuclease/exonuclease/phosphatase (EEP) superfamily protein YafD
VQELTPELAKSLAEADLAELLPFSCLDPRPSSRGIGLWSRWPLTQLAPVPGTRTAMPRVQLDLGWPVTITVVHPAAPMRGGQRAWQQDMDRLLSALTDLPGQHLVAGDFNASRDHRPFRRLLAAHLADCADAAQRRPWPGFTWPANRRIPPVMRLDHILVSQPGAVVCETRTIGIPGTDHRGVFAIIELRPIRSEDAASSG